MELTPSIRRGVVVALAAAVVSGFAVFVNGLAVRRFDDATVYTTAKNAIAGSILLIAALTARQRTGSPTSSRSTPVAPLALIALIGGAIPFVLFFEGLARATSTNAAFIHKTLIVWVAIGATAALRERFDLVHAGAVGALLLGYAIVGGGGPDSFGRGEAMILTATLLWAGEVVLVKSVLPSVPALTAATTRMAGGAVILLCWVALRGDLGTLLSLSATQWSWLVLTGVTLSIFVATWYHALASAPAIDVTAVLVLGAVITGALNSGFRGVPVTTASAGYVLLAVAASVVAAARLRPEPTGATP